MDEDLAEFYVCSECWNEFDDSDLERAREERREERQEAGEVQGDDDSDDIAEE